MNTKYTRELIEPLLKDAKSFYDLARLVGIAPTGSNTTNLKRRCVEYGFDLSHWLGHGHRKGKRALNKKHYSDFLIEGTPLDRRLEASTLRKAMIESGIEYKCSADGCSLVDTWNGKSLRLHIDHVDGRHWNNRKENVRFLCPNCHTQTLTWGR